MGLPCVAKCGTPRREYQSPAGDSSKNRFDGKCSRSLGVCYKRLRNSILMHRFAPTIFNYLAAAAIPLFVAVGPARAAEPSKEGLELFEKHIRPIFVEECYECHSVQSGKSKGHLLLDSRQGGAKGGENGPALTPGDPEQSRMIKAIRWS